MSRASLALAQLPSACNGEARVIQSHDFGNDAARAFSFAAETVETAAAPMCSFQLHLDKATELFETKKRAAEPAEPELRAASELAAEQASHQPQLAQSAAAHAALAELPQYRELAQK